MKPIRILPILSRLLLVAGLLFTAAAQADPPGRVGRLSLLQGTVSLRNEDTGEWLGASLNWPITTNDVLWAGPGARAEISVGSTVLRLDGGTELEVVQLDDEYFRVRLLRGSASVRLGNAYQSQRFELATPHGQTSGTDAGSYRFDVGDGVTALTVMRGITSFAGSGRLYVVSRGQRAEFTYSGQLEMYLAEPRRDDFADWVAYRDQREDRWRDPRWISPEMTGYADLSEYGDWQDGGPYGAVWTPRLVPVGWTPYSRGRWAVIGPWGWTWIDDAPWGFAPFHYGRWIFWRNRWAWAPGAYTESPVYAPALVAWIGPQTNQVFLNSPSPSVGWFPLGYGEPYYPSYSVSITYVQRINVGHVRRIESVRPAAPANFANRAVPGAVTIVQASVVSSGTPVQQAVKRVLDTRAISALPAITAPPVVPVLRRDDAHRDWHAAPPWERGRDRPQERPRDAVRPTAPSAPAAVIAPPAATVPAPVPQAPPAPAFRRVVPSPDVAAESTKSKPPRANEGPRRDTPAPVRREEPDARRIPPPSPAPANEADAKRHRDSGDGKPVAAPINRSPEAEARPSREHGRRDQEAAQFKREPQAAKEAVKEKPAAAPEREKEVRHKPQGENR